MDLRRHRTFKNKGRIDKIRVGGAMKGKGTDRGNKSANSMSVRKDVEEPNAGKREQKEMKQSFNKVADHQEGPRSIKRGTASLGEE